MNQPIVRLFGLVIAMFALLLAFTSRWTIFEAGSLRDNPLNARSLLEQQRIDRGEILASNGKVLARSVRSTASRQSEAIYMRTYPTGEEFAHAVGYYYIDLGRTGLESYRNSELSGQSSTNLQSILDQLQGKRKQGNDVYTTLDAGAQQVANSALEGREGAVVALEPRSGAVKVMASSPGYNPNVLRSTRNYERLAKTASGKPLVDRATQFGYAPGSTFKVVTATAAIDSGKFSRESTVDGRNDVRVSGVPLQNDENESFGQITLTQALAKSVNTVWAQVAERVGKRTMAELHAPLRLRQKAAAGLPGDGDVLERRVQPRADRGADELAGRRRAHGHRPGQTRGHAAADGGGRGDGGERRAADATAHDRADRRPGRAHGAAHLPTRAVGRDEALDGGRGQADDGSGGQRRHGHAGADRGRAGGRQDGHGGDADRHGDQQRVVHRVCAGVEPEGGDRGDAEGRAGTGGGVRGTDRARGHGKAAA